MSVRTIYVLPTQDPCNISVLLTRTRSQSFFPIIFLPIKEPLQILRIYSQIWWSGFKSPKRPARPDNPNICHTKFKNRTGTRSQSYLNRIMLSCQHHGYYESLKKPTRNHRPPYEPSKNSLSPFQIKNHIHQKDDQVYKTNRPLPEQFSRQRTRTIQVLLHLKYIGTDSNHRLVYVFSLPHLHNKFFCTGSDTCVTALKIHRYGFQPPTRLCFFLPHLHNSFSVPDPTYSLSKESPPNLFHRIFQVCTMYFSRPVPG